MKKLFLVLNMFIFSLILHAQTEETEMPVYYDALTLYNHTDNSGVFKTSATDKDTINAILEKYFSTDISSVNGFRDSTKNPFLFKMFNPGSPFSGTTSPVSLTKMISGIGNLDVTSFADGLAKFLVKRTKQELYVAFFERFPEFKKSYPEFPVLFPNATLVINNFQAWEYSNILNTIREAFDKDLKEILSDLPKIIEIQTTDTASCKCNEKALNRLKKIQVFFTSEMGIMLSSALILGSEFISGSKLPVIINKIASKENLEKIKLSNVSLCENIKNSLALLRIVSNSIQNTDVSKSYISKQEIENLFNNSAERNIFLGLLYQQIKNEKIKINGIDVTNIITPSRINGTATYLKNFVGQSLLFSNAVVKLSEAKQTATGDLSEYMAAVFQSANKLIPAITNFELIDPSIALPVNIKNIIAKSESTIEIAHDIAIKNYSAVVVGLLKMFSGITSGTDDITPFREFIVKYGSFAANVVQSQNSDDIEKAIETLALPVGSASIKKHSRSNISLQAYTGVYGGMQKQATDKKSVGVAGIYAPVGIAYSRGYSFLKKNGKTVHGSFSLFASAIDIGPLVSFRFSNYNDTLANDIKIRLNQIISPGIHLVWGIPGVPLSLGAGCNWSPLLTRVEKDAIKINPDNTNAFRYQLFLAVDIPLLNFHNKSRHE